jgi:septal ring factor EnvC (AmiA/AmiB activator)
MKTKTSWGKIFLALIVGVGLFVSPQISSANHSAAHRKALEEFQKARELSAQKAREAAELQSVVNQLNSQIRQVQGQINSTAGQISKTESEIADLSSQIKVKEEDLAREQENQDEAIRVLYETSGQSTLEVLVGSDSISSLVSHSEYLEALEVRIEATIAEIEKLKAELEQKKADLETRRNELVALQHQFQLQRSLLQGQESEKARLLSNTRTELANFKAEEDEARRNLNRIEAQLQTTVSRICRDGVKGSGPRVGQRVNRGSVIGYEGSTGYSTGPHVHFEVCSAGRAVNPIGYVPPLSWPLSSGFRITQGFGMTEYALAGAYGGAGHTGIDMTVAYGAPVYASDSGEIVLDQYFGGYGNAVVIDHGNGIFTLYGHMID